MQGTHLELSRKRGLQTWIGEEAKHVVGIPTEVKCAPENWVVRRPVSRVEICATRYHARYPPRNLLNARARQGSRETHVWVPVQTYADPLPDYSQYPQLAAAKNIANTYTDITVPLNFLDILCAVFENMGDDRSKCFGPVVAENCHSTVSFSSSKVQKKSMVVQKSF